MAKKKNEGLEKVEIKIPKKEALEHVESAPEVQLPVSEDFQMHPKFDKFKKPHGGK